MATNNATLGLFTAKDANTIQGGPAPYFKRGLLAGLQFDNTISVASYFAGVLPRGANAGYTATTGVKVILGWKSKSGLVTGAVKWAAAFNLAGATDVPNPEPDNFPVAGATNEVAATTTATTVQGITYTSISVPLAKIQNGQTTAPAAGDFFNLRVRRLGSADAADTLADQAILVSVELQDY